MTNDIVPYRQPPKRVIVHHVHHVTVEHDDASDLRWQLKLVIASWLFCALVLAAIAGAELVMRAAG